MSTERDDTTRYLCAAAHLDDRFADRVIREFLTEPTRAVRPVAGVRAGAVLAEAVAARARRKVRDTLPAVLFTTGGSSTSYGDADLTPAAALAILLPAVLLVDEFVVWRHVVDPPYPLVRGQRVRELRDKPLEWARYYPRFLALPMTMPATGAVS